MEKAPGAFRTISEVAEEIDVPQHVLRFWESRFTQIRPMKRGGGRRFYRPEDVDLLRGVRHLLYGEGYTIRGVQRILREQGPAFVQNVWRAGAEPPPPQAQEDAEDFTPSAGERSEPDFSQLSFVAAPPRRNAAEPAATVQRREPASAPVEQRSKGVGMSADDRRKLHTALDELLACQQLIEAALRGGNPADQSEAAGS